MSIHDWAAKCAARLREEPTPISQERIAAIIAFHAEPLMNMLRDCKQDHSLMCEGEDNCTCGTAHWNARIEAVLNGA